MAGAHQTKHGWLKIVSPIVFTLAGLGITELPATAMPKIESFSNELYLAQVGVRSRVVPPTPLNLKPRYHIPLPASNYNYHRRTYDDRDNYYYRDRHHHHKYSRRGSRSRRPVIIIINPAAEQHRSTSQKYIRVIRR